MSEFNIGSQEPYRTDVEAMFELADELPLIHCPDVIVRGKLDARSMDMEVAGRPLEEYDPESEEGRRASKYAAEGLYNLPLFGKEALKALVEARWNALISGTAADVIEKDKAQSQMSGADASYSVYHFSNAQSGEKFVVTNYRIGGTTDTVRARRLVVSIDDNQLHKELTIDELPTSLNGDTILDVKQTMSPANNDAAYEAAKMYSAFNLPNPDMAAPSIEELEEYKDILSRLRSGSK